MSITTAAPAGTRNVLAFPVEEMMRAMMLHIGREKELYALQAVLFGEASAAAVIQSTDPRALGAHHLGRLLSWYGAAGRSAMYIFLVFSKADRLRASIPSVSLQSAIAPAMCLRNLPTEGQNG